MKPSTAIATFDPTGVVDRLEDAVGGRQKLLDALALVPQPDDDPITYVIRLISDPHADTYKLSTVCKRAGISVPDFLEALKRGQYAAMLIQVQTSIAAKTPEIVDDVLLRAAPHLIDCHWCLGSQTLKDGSSCSCTRTESPGKELVLPDLDRQELALKLANLLPKSGPLVAIQQNTTAPTFGDASPAGFAKLLHAVDQITRAAPPPVVEADTVTTVDPLPSTP